MSGKMDRYRSCLAVAFRQGIRQTIVTYRFPGNRGVRQTAQPTELVQLAHYLDRCPARSRFRFSHLEGVELVAREPLSEPILRKECTAEI